MHENALSEAVDFLLGHNDFVILSHHLPDGDAVGSALALLHLLRDNGKKATVLMPDGIPAKYKVFFCSGVETSPEFFKSHRPEATILLDTPSPARASGYEELGFTGPTLNIDHHPDNSEYADFNLADHTAAATAELIYYIAEKIPEWKVSDACVNCLLLGIVTDSGCFRFANTGPKMMRTAANLLERGGDLQRIVTMTYFSRPLNELQFEAELISQHLKTDFDGRFVWISIPPEIVEKYNFDLKNTEVLIDSVRSVSGGLAAALLRHVPDGVKCSLRSKDAAVSVGRVARHFGGGGHEMAAGTLIPVKTFAEAENLLLAEIKKELDNAL